MIGQEKYVLDDNNIKFLQDTFKNKRKKLTDFSEKYNFLKLNSIGYDSIKNSVKIMFKYLIL